MKMLINVPESVVVDALRGMAAAHPELIVDVENRVIVRRDAPVAGKVALISGAARGTSRCTADSWAPACCRVPAPARCSRRRFLIRWPAPRPWTAGRACCSS